jgi:hypothetical protein
MPLATKPGIVKIPRTPTEKCLPGGRTLITLRPDFTSLDADNNTLPFTFALNSLGPNAVDDVRGIYIENNHQDANGQIGTLTITVQDTGQQIQVAQNGVVALPLWITGTGVLLITVVPKNSGQSGGAPFIELLNFDVMPFYFTPPSSGGGSGASIPVSTVGAVSATGAATNVFGATTLTCMYIDILEDISLSNIAVYVSAPDDGSNLQDLGIYDPTTGNLLANIGPVTGILAGVNTFPINQGTIMLPKGHYIFALTASTNGTGFSIEIGEPQVISTFYTTTTHSAAGTGVLPATIVPVPHFGYGPTVGILGYAAYPIVQLT